MLKNLAAKLIISLHGIILRVFECKFCFATISKHFKTSEVTDHHKISFPAYDAVKGLLLVWFSWIAGLMNRELHFGIGIIVGTLPSGFRVFEVIVPGCSGTVPEHVSTCGFIGNSSSLDRPRKIRNSVRLNSWDSFLVTLHSIFFEAWVMCSSVNPGTNVFWNWLFLAFSCVSLETAANFRLFISVAIVLGDKEKTQQ